MQIKPEFNCAIVGLGKVGILFDEEPGRTGIWTHFSALEALHSEGFHLVAVCDPDPTKLDLARKRKASLRTYISLPEMLASEELDLVTLSSPTVLHGAQIQECAGKVPFILCEKPLGHDLPSAMAALRACEKSGSVLAVNYYKRWDASFPHAQKLTRELKKIGPLRIASASYTGPLDAVGSHAADLLISFMGEPRLLSAHQFGTVMVANAIFPGEVLGELRQLGEREKFLFELDFLGTEGRIRVLGNGDNVELTVFHPSPRYAGYEELVAESITAPVQLPRFLPIYRELMQKRADPKFRLTCDGASALATQKFLQSIQESL